MASHIICFNNVYNILDFFDIDVNHFPTEIIIALSIAFITTYIDSFDSFQIGIILNIKRETTLIEKEIIVFNAYIKQNNIEEFIEIKYNSHSIPGFYYIYKQLFFVKYSIYSSPKFVIISSSSSSDSRI